MHTRVSFQIGAIIHAVIVASSTLLMARPLPAQAQEAVAADAARGNLRYSITVSKFENEAGWHGQWDLGDGFATIMTDALQGSGKFIVLGDAEMRGTALAEQDLAASGRMAGGKKAPATGQMTPAQLLVRGSVTHVQESTGGGAGGIGFKGIRLGGAKDNAEVNITMYLVDSRTGQVKASTKVVGKSAKRGLNIGYDGPKLGGLTGGVGGHKNDNVGKACEDAVAQGVEFLVRQLEKIPWQGSIALAKGDKIAVNRGTRDGVALGMRFDVGQAEEIVDEDTGEVIDSSLTQVAAIEVTEVKEKIAYCRALSGGDKIAKGMSVFPAR
jgi:curli biogenesis system outer membrane secretion channel CsgG